MTRRTVRRDRRNQQHGHGWTDPEAAALQAVRRNRRTAWELRSGSVWSALGASANKVGEAFIRIAVSVDEYRASLSKFTAAIGQDR